MGSFAKHMILCHTNLNINSEHHRHEKDEELKPQPQFTVRRRSAMAVAAATVMLEVRKPAPAANAQSWGTRSFIKEKYFQPGLSPEEAVERIKQTTEGLREMRHMLDTMSWRYVMFYIRLKSAYLDADLKNAMATLPESRRKSYVKTANEVVDNMSELDRYVRSPKVYESYLYYEKTLESLDELVSMFA